MRICAGVVALAACAACSRHAPAPAERAVDAHDASPVDASPADARAPLGGVPWQIDLIDGTTKLGCVSVPLGAREPRPIMIALHGGSDRPEWACSAWRGITNAYPFIVCPRGVGANDAALAWSSPADTKQRVARAIAATKTMFEGWIREAPIVLAGFSMGATQAALLAKSEPRTYARIALAESAYAPEPVMTFAPAWAAGGAERAIFLCTTLGCEAPYRSAARNVASHHVPARLNIAGTTEHGMWDVVVRSMRRDWPWLVERAAGWESYPPPAEETPLPGKTETFEAR
jgi:poly(3-hydroxybutyrate) depolymerase